ncbi:MAG: hypothetical protein H6Q00_1396 [Holophagaceae bacterium]|nr:hypothetical protein [Holophagaceae bacterium]
MNNLRCPQCGSEDVTVTAEQMFMANTGDHYCHSVKAHDNDAKAGCLKCGWSGLREALEGGSHA